MRSTDVQTLFPEYTDAAELRGFLTRISGDLPDDGVQPDDRTSELLALGALCEDPPGTGPAMFDAFARAFGERYRAEAEAVFAGSPLTARAAATLAGELLDWLVERVQNASVRTLVVALDLMRAAGVLPGETADDRLRHFCDLTGTEAFRETLFRVFPELRRQLDVLAEGSVRHARRLVEATGDAVAGGVLTADAIGAGPAELRHIGYGLGDSHAGGQVVSLLTFGSGRLLVYKPRSMAAERAYAGFLARVNAAAGFALPVLRVWCGAECGWQEYADQAPAREDPAYYRTAGRLLGVLNLLRAGDMHYENVLNHGGLPVVIDAESLFSVNHRAGAGGAGSAAEALAHTVWSTGFLPTRIADPAEPNRSIDIGFLGYVPGQQAVTAVPTLEGFGTDRPRVTMTTGSVDTPAIRPSTVPRGVELRELCRGFAECWDWAAGDAGRVERWMRELFADLPTRAVLEATSRYYKLLRTSTHPAFQMSTDRKRILLHRVGLGRLDHFTAPVVRAEIDDLLQGDIPFFTLRTGSRWVHHRGRPIADVLRQTPLDQAVAGLRRMSDEGRERNLRIIRAAYADLTEPECDAPAYRPGVRRPAPAPAGRVREAVDVIAAELSGAVITAARPEWIGATIRDTTQEHPWRVGELADDLYAGVAGLALFLAAAGVLTGRRRYRDLARDALAPRVEALLADPARRRREVTGGVAGGYPGVAFAALEAGRLIGSAELAELGARLWDHLPGDLGQITDSDFLMGTSGLLAASLTAGRPLVSEALFRHLRAAPLPAPGKPVYSGFAHGTSGRLAAVARYAAVTGGAGATLAGLERAHAGLYNAAEGHWPISDRAPERTARGWCHGTPGVLLGVTERLAVLPGSAPLDVAELAEQVRTGGFGLNLSLCHGDAGNLLILGQAARWDPTGRTAERFADRRGQLAAAIVPRALRARTGKSVLNDSLYVGLAGIGMGLLLSTGEVDVASPLTFRRDTP
ncbi:type 2 lanthipeptide synthetase LanM family protein [Actinoplanes sp. NPDC023714]|uniref:type 2 lanthipeptide synthetase LanM family protein n=1 Tax=Actinoplanes sp. NPDC023714 TaxID=3154322 RepID=UPI0033E6ED29